MGFAPLHTDPWIQVVQLAGAQGNRLRRISHIHILQKGSATFSHISHIHIYAPKRKFCVTLLSVFWISSCSNSLRSQFYKQTQRKRQQIQNIDKEGNISGWQLKPTFGRLSSFYRDLPCRLHF